MQGERAMKRLFAVMTLVAVAVTIVVAAGGSAKTGSSPQRRQLPTR